MTIMGVHGKITINGVSIEVSQGNITVRNGDVFVDGNRIHLKDNIKDITIIGDTGDVDADGSVTVKGNVQGSIDAGGSIECGDVGGNVDAGGSVTAGSVEGDIDAGGSVRIHK